MKGEDKLNHDKSVFNLSNRIPASVDELLFIIYYAVKSYLSSLDNIPKKTLYKVFVTYKDNLIPQYFAA